jgi:hypothetical protein
MLVTIQQVQECKLEWWKFIGSYLQFNYQYWFLWFSSRKRITSEVVMALKHTAKIFLSRPATTFFTDNCWPTKQTILMIFWLGMTECNYEGIWIYDIMCSTNRKILHIIQETWEGMAANSACNCDVVSNIVARYIKTNTPYGLRVVQLRIISKTEKE